MRHNNWEAELAALLMAFRKVAQAVVLCDSSDPNNPIMDGRLYKEAMRVISEVDEEYET